MYSRSLVIRTPKGTFLLEYLGMLCVLLGGKVLHINHGLQISKQIHLSEHCKVPEYNWGSTIPCILTFVVVEEGMEHKGSTMLLAF